MELIDHQMPFVRPLITDMVIIPLSIYFIYEDRYISRQTKYQIESVKNSLLEDITLVAEGY